MITKIINANPYGPLLQKKLGEFEKQAHITLPNDYRNFLLRYNGGQPTPSFFWIKLQEDGSSIHQFYGLHDDPVFLSLKTFAGKERYGIPESMLPIGDDGTGNYICIGISSTNFGKVFFLDHDKHPFHNPNSLDGIMELADSFTEFLLSLIESPK